MPKATFNDYNAAAACVNLLLQFPCLLHLSWSFVGNLKFLKVYEKNPEFWRRHVYEFIASSPSEMIWDDCFSCHGSFLISWGAGWTQCNFCCVWNISRLRIVQSTMWQLGGGALANDSLDTWKWCIRIRSYQIYKPCHPAATVSTIVSTRAVLRIDTAETKQHRISASRLSAWLSPGRDRIRDRKTLRRKKRPGLGQTTWKNRRNKESSRLSTLCVPIHEQVQIGKG